MVNCREVALLSFNSFKPFVNLSNDFVDQIYNNYGLDRRDASLAANIFLGTVQNNYYLDYIISICSDIEITSIDKIVLNILRISVYQLAFLDRVPNHAAVYNSVELCKKYKPKACSFVNAVLRKVISTINSIEIPQEDFSKYLSIKYSISNWFSQYLINTFGKSFSKEFLEASQNYNCMCIRVNTCKIKFNEFLDLIVINGISLIEAFDSENFIFIESYRVADIPGYSEGLFFVQDFGAGCISSLPEIKQGINLLDACASPGGKSFAAAVKMNNTGSIISCDINEKKINRITSGASRLGLSIIETKVADAKEYCSTYDSFFDVVIADVPCSGFGVIRKKPEIKYKTDKEISSLPVIQSKIINNLSKYVKPGGILVYSTCTVIKEENNIVIEQFLNDHDNFIVDDFTCHGFSSTNGMYTFWPNVQNSDGFFIAKLKRTH